MVRQELQFESNGKEKFALLILTLITRHNYATYILFSKWHLLFYIQLFFPTLLFFHLTFFEL